MHKTLFWILASIVVLASSCGQARRYTLLIPGKNQHDSLYKQNFPYYKLQAADILYVQVKSLNKEITELFASSSTSSSSSAQGGTGGGMYLSGNSVDKDGNIQLPVLGIVHVAGLTVDEARDTLQRRALVYISDAIVEVKLVSFKVSFLGELHGQVTVMNDRANILEVLSMSGGVPYTGNHKNLLILRSENGYTHTIPVDLSKRELLSSAQYYLQPNDLVYMEPRKSTAFKLWMSDYSAYLSIFTSVATLYLLIINLKK